ncbi:hypothetical protein ACXWTF_12740 [Thiomicrolovo sp. ZZH C-3]
MKERFWPERGEIGVDGKLLTFMFMNVPGFIIISGYFVMDLLHRIPAAESKSAMLEMIVGFAVANISAVMLFLRVERQGRPFVPHILWRGVEYCECGFALLAVRMTWFVALVYIAFLVHSL